MMVEGDPQVAHEVPRGDVREVAGDELAHAPHGVDAGVEQGEHREVPGEGTRAVPFEKPEQAAVHYPLDLDVVEKLPQDPRAGQVEQGDAEGGDDAGGHVPAVRSQECLQAPERVQAYVRPLTQVFASPERCS